MCAVSAVGDQWSQTIPGRYPWATEPQQYPSALRPVTFDDSVTRAEFAALTRDVEQMREELRVAKAQDIADGVPDCEMEDKVELLKRVAALVGVSLEDVFG